MPLQGTSHSPLGPEPTYHDTTGGFVAPKSRMTYTTWHEKTSRAAVNFGIFVAYLV